MGKLSRKKAKAVKTATPIAEERPPAPAEALQSKSSLFQRYYVHLILIAMIGFLAYSNTFNAPFQWDDKYQFLKENPIVKDLSYFLEPSKAKDLGQYDAFKSRFVGYLTFALNYAIHGLNVTGYHLVNLTIHLGNAILLYHLVLSIYKTPFFSTKAIEAVRFRLVALFVALLFVSHPIQTEAVTYVFQRFASLVTFFFLSALLAYLKAAFTPEKAKRGRFYALSILAALLAVKTKENSFTLPFVIALMDFFFLKSPLKRRLLRLIPFCTISLIIPVSLMHTDKSAVELVSGFIATSEGFQGISRWDYFTTQFSVIVTYLRLLVFPINQNIDYDYPIFDSFFRPEVIFSLIFLVSIFWGAVFLVRRSKREAPELRLISFGVFWFFTTLSVESSVIPLPMLINEYRVYLPSVGFFMASTAGAFLLRKKIQTKNAFFLTLSLIVLVFSVLTYARNTVWKTRWGYGKIL